MAKEKPSIPKGTRDFGPQEVAKRKYILNTIEKVFIKYGFMPIETPTMENLSTLTGKYGDEGDKLLFKVLNSGDAFKEIREKHGEEKISNFEFRISDLSDKGLRYDLTVPFARYVVMNRNEITFPFKRYQMQPVWRADRPQKGRYREFWQCDADVVGSDSLLNELDLIQIYAEVFDKLGITNYELRINNRKILEGLALAMNCYDRFIDFTTKLDKIDKVGLDAVLSEMFAEGLISSEELLKTFFNYLNSSKTISEKLEYLKTSTLNNYEPFKNGVNEIDFVVSNCLTLNPNTNIKIDGTLARGLGYYTGCIFEVVVNDENCTLKSSIGGGGRYDNLTGIFGLDGVSGVGISFGLDRIYDVLEELDLFPKDTQSSHTKVLFCYFDEASQAYALQGVTALRNAGIASQIYPDVVKKIGKQLDFANKLNIPFAAVAGTDEIAQQKFMFKDLNESKQELLSIEEIIERLKN